jgi:hypothetical protein
MNLQTAHGLERTAPNVGVAKEQTFESLLRIPETHRLAPVRSRSRGGIDSAVYWEFEEYDETGRLVARYQTFDERSAGRASSIAKVTSLLSTRQTKHCKFL